MRYAARLPASDGPPAEPSVAPVASYPEQLAAYETRRRAADNLLLRKMMNLRDGMPSGRLS